MKLKLGKPEQNKLLTPDVPGIEIEDNLVIVDTEQFVLPSRQTIQEVIDIQPGRVKGNQVFLFHNEHPNRAQAAVESGLKWRKVTKPEEKENEE